MGSISQPITVQKGSTSTTITGLANGTAYTFLVTAVYTDDVRTSGSSTIPITPESVTDAIPPGEVGNLEAAASNQSVALSWTEPGDSDFAGIEISFTPTVAAITQPISVAKGTTIRTIYGLTNNTPYTFVLKTIDTSNNESTGVPIVATPTAEPANIVSPSVTLNDTTNYRVDSLWIGKSSSSSSYVYGIAKITYLGSINRSFIQVNAAYLNNSNGLIWAESSYVYNRTQSGTGSTNTGTFFTPTYNVGYFFIIEDLSTYNASVSDIASVSLTITNSSSSYAAPYGHVSTTGAPYRVGNDSWYQNIINDGSTTVTLDYSRFIFQDSQGRMFKWASPTAYVASVETDDMPVGQPGYYTAAYITPDYLTTDLAWGDITLDWSPYESGSAPPPALSTSQSDQTAIFHDEQNEMMLEVIDNLTSVKLEALLVSGAP